MAFTYFFRDMQTLEAIRDYALPVLKTYRYIDIWDAGCAMGPEPYSLSMVLRESMGHMYFRNVRIKATDIDESNLFGDIIDSGKYPKEQVDRIPKEIIDKYFIEDEGSKDFKLSDEIKSSVKFQKHDLLSLQPIGDNFGLILCKNVLLHFTEEQRIEVIKMFYSSLKNDGFLAMEQTQKLPKEAEDLFELVVNNTQLFRKRLI